MTATITPGNLAPKRIPDLPAAGTLTGAEFIPGIQNGLTVRMTATQFINAVLLSVTAQRTVTAAGPVTVLVSDFQVLLNKTVGEATVVNLPSAALVVSGAYNYAPKIIKDLKGDAGTNNITLTPAVGETIDGQATMPMGGNYASATLWPLANGTGWFVAW